MTGGGPEDGPGDRIELGLTAGGDVALHRGAQLGVRLVVLGQG